MWEFLDKLEFSKSFNVIAAIFFPIVIPASIIFCIWRFFYVILVGECRAKVWTADYDEQFYSIFVRKGFKGCVFSQMSKPLFLRKYNEMKETDGSYKLTLKDANRYYTYTFSDKERKKILKSMEKIVAQF